jgi:hypothetical protein
MSQTDLSARFAAFAGRPVAAADTPVTHERRGRTYHLNRIVIEENCPTLAALRAAVAAAKLQLRLIVPGKMYTQDYRLDRLNAYLAKKDDGTYCLGTQFRLG